MGSKINLENAKLSTKSYGFMTQLGSIKDMAGDMVETVKATGDKTGIVTEKRKGATVITYLLSFLVLGYQLYYIHQHDTITSGVVVWDIFIFFSAIILGGYLVSHSGHKFRKLLGGLLLQTLMPALILGRYFPETQNLLSSWGGIYSIGILLGILCFSFAVTKSFLGFILSVSTIAALLTIGYVLKVYFGNGLADKIGVVIWAIIAFIGGPTCALIIFDEVKSTVRRLYSIIAALSVPALGILDTMWYPTAFLRGWWLVFLIGFILAAVNASLIENK